MRKHGSLTFIVVFFEHWMDTNCGASNNCDGCDLDFSGTVDIYDLLILIEHWMEGT